MITNGISAVSKNKRAKWWAATKVVSAFTMAPNAAIVSNPKFKQAVEYVAARENRIIVFLVRDDARTSFYQARDYARGNGAVTSKVPLLGGGDLDLKEFFNKRR